MHQATDEISGLVWCVTILVMSVGVSNASSLTHNDRKCLRVPDFKNPDGVFYCPEAQSSMGCSTKMIYPHKHIKNFAKPAPSHEIALSSCWFGRQTRAVVYDSRLIVAYNSTGWNSRFSPYVVDDAKNTPLFADKSDVNNEKKIKLVNQCQRPEHFRTDAQPGVNYFYFRHS